MAKKKAVAVEATEEVTPVVEATEEITKEQICEFY